MQTFLRSSSLGRLKSKGSERTLPIVGASLWATETAVEASKHSPYLFPCYCNNKGCKAKPASAAMNKWLKQTIGGGYVIPRFRHSIRDRLTAINCPSEMIDQLGGWSSGKVVEGYREGYSVLQTAQWMTGLRLTP